MTADDAAALVPGLYRVEFADRDPADGLVVGGYRRVAPAVRAVVPELVYPADDGHRVTLRDWTPVVRCVPLSVVPGEPGTALQVAAQQLAAKLLEADPASWDRAAVCRLLDECNELFHDRPSVEAQVRAAVDAEQERCRKIAENAAEHWRLGAESGTPRQRAVYDNRSSAATIIASFIRRERELPPIPPFIEERSHAPAD